MSNNNRIKLTNIIAKLPEEAIDTLYNTAFSLLDTFSIPDKPACPYCGNTHVVKNGHKCRKQEYLCKCCRKTYVSTTKTLMADSHQPREVWEEVIQYTVSGSSIDYTAKKVGLTHDCVFNMRHKILIAIRDILAEEKICLSGVSELDETFVLDSYKGSSLPDSVLRPTRKHGAVAQKRGISNEYVCICTGVERKGSAMAETVNRAKPSSAELQSVFGSHISEDALVLCDGLKSYLALEGSTGCSIKDISMGENGRFYNLNTVNNFHSFIKNRYIFYRSVATKYLNRYNALFSFAYKHTEDKVRQLCSKLLQVGTISRQHTICEVRDNGLLLI